MLCLDTNIVIALLARRDHRVAERFRAAVPLGVAIPIHVASELWYGVWNSARVRENTERLALFFNAPISVLPFDADDANETGRIRAHLKKAGTPIGPYDLLIAAQVRRRASTLATLNAKEFAHVPGLVIDDWSK
ncbi:MAG: type II toxin-antitoxin system VapC family toxin [Micropepsaceae bacterium]